MTQEVDTMQGDGKIRLIAKGGRFRESNITQASRELMAASNQEMREAGKREDRKGVEVARLKGLIASNTLMYGEGVGNYYVEFDATPDITESGTADYLEASQIRAPGSVILYMGSPSRNFSINGKLIARDYNEAQRVSNQIHLLKSWRMPETYSGGVASGPPTILYLQGYGKMFKDIPVVLTDLSIELSSEHDYIPTHASRQTLKYEESVSKAVFGDASVKFEDSRVNRTKSYDTHVPVITTVSLTLKEAHAADGKIEGFDKFDILKYRNGNLPNW